MRRGMLVFGEEPVRFVVGIDDGAKEVVGYTTL